MHTYRLCDIGPDEDCQVLRIEPSENIKRRFYEIGLIPKTKIRCVATAPGGDPKAFRIRGAVIAIRQEDSRRVLVCKEEL